MNENVIKALKIVEEIYTSLDINVEKEYPADVDLREKQALKDFMNSRVGGEGNQTSQC